MAKNLLRDFRRHIKIVENMTKTVNVLRPTSHKSFLGNRYWNKKGCLIFVFKVGFHIFFEKLQYS